MNPWLMAAILAVIVVVAIVTRPKRDADDADGAEGTERRATAPAGDDGPARSVLDDDDDDDSAHEPVPVTAEGLALLSVGHEIRLLELVGGEEAPETLPPWLRSALDSGSAPFGAVNALYQPAAGRVAGAAHGLSAGDFTAARIRPGVAGSYAYRVETLGRDGDFGFFPFTTRAGAESALRLLETQGIVARPRDEDGEPLPASDEDFEEARRRYEESERLLALEDDDDEGTGPAWSDRR